MKIAIIIGYIVVGLLTFLGMYIVVGGNKDDDVISIDASCIMVGLMWPIFLGFGILSIIVYGIYKVLNLILFQWLKKIGDKYRCSILSKLYKILKKIGV